MTEDLGPAPDRARRVEDLPVEAAGRLLVVDRVPGFVLLDPAGMEFDSATQWMKGLTANDCSPHTVRAYGLSLLRFMRFLWAVGQRWDRATDVDVRDFVLWARQANKFVGAKNEPAGRLAINRVTGKRTQSSRYSPSTINHTLSAVHEFYDFFLGRSQGLLVNPVPGSAGRHSHHDPESSFVHRRRVTLRQREVTRLPRALPDEMFNAVFQRLSSNRDRALIAFYVSSGARASELLALTGDMINYGDQLIGVVRKGGKQQWLPVAPDALVWLRLYQLERGVAGPGQPVWLTLREPRRPMSYDALRAVLGRVNESLGSNWTAHDLRHTFAIRALDGGLPLHELQLLLGHDSLETTSIYLTPRMEDVSLQGPRRWSAR